MGYTLEKAGELCSKCAVMEGITLREKMITDKMGKVSGT